ncbi:MAG: ATP-binding protein [Oribacterium sp.]|nr:ATP-binding protein [Oribacterium sp.]
MKVVNTIKRSIKWKFTMIFICLILFLLMTIFAANSFLLERYYTKEKVSTLESAYNYLDSMIAAAGTDGDGAIALFPEDADNQDTGNETDAVRYVKSLSETNNLSIVILDTATDRAFAVGSNAESQAQKLTEYIFGNRDHFQGNVLERFDNYSIERNMNKMTKSMYLESWGYFSDNTTCFLMSMPVSGLHDAVHFFNRFLIVIGLIALILGSVIVYFTSRRITRPINSLARLSEQMSNLDFSARYEGDSEDEIGTLGNSMNVLSEKLESSIAELKTANNELQSDIENKTRIDQRRQEFVANVSHELKTPIALIQGYAEGLQDGMAEDPASRDYYCGVIVDEAQKMNRMVKELLNVSAIEQGRDLPDIALFNLSKVVSGVVTASDILIRQSNAHVEVDVPESINVWADEFKIEEVISNYLNNALHHLKEPNQISIYSEKKPNGIIELHVSNTGNPIPEEDLDKIWEKFFKVDKAHTRSYGGSGLGLSIVKAIMDAHHQKCGVKNTRTGVDFWITLDAEEKQHA